MKKADAVNISFEIQWAELFKNILSYFRSKNIQIDSLLPKGLLKVPFEILA